MINISKQPLDFRLPREMWSKKRLSQRCLQWKRLLSNRSRDWWVGTLPSAWLLSHQASMALILSSESAYVCFYCPLNHPWLLLNNSCVPAYKYNWVSFFTLHSICLLPVHDFAQSVRPWAICRPTMPAQIWFPFPHSSVLTRCFMTSRVKGPCTAPPHLFGAFRVGREQEFISQMISFPHPKFGWFCANLIYKRCILTTLE